MRAQRPGQCPRGPPHFCATTSPGPELVAKQQTAPPESPKRCRQSRRSSFELVKLIDVGRSIVTVNGDHERETDSSFSGGDGDGKNRDHHTSELMRFGTEAPKRDEI